MVKKLIVGVASGYLLKLVQVVCNLALIPFLISDGIFGLAGYGGLSVVLATIGLMAAGYDGWRLSTARRLGIAEKTGEAAYLPLLIITISSVLLLCMGAHLYGSQIIKLIGISSPSIHLALYMTIYFLFEQINFLSEQCFHAKGKTWIVNLLILLEVVCRTITIFWLFNIINPSIELYLKVFIIYMIAKYMVYLVLFFLNKNNGSTPFVLTRIREELDTFLYSLPLSLKGLSVFAVFRLTVIVVNKYLAPELAAIYSILMVTLRGYVLQLFFSVVRPMIVPVTAGIEISKLSKSSRLQLQSLLKGYEFVVCTTCLVMACLVPVWLSHWLDKDMSHYHLLFIAGIAFFGLEVSSSVKNLLLVSQGYGKTLTSFTVIMSVSFLIYLGLITVNFETLTMELIMIGVIVFIVLYAGVSVPYLFSNRILKDKNRSFLALPATYVFIVLSSLVTIEWLRYKDLPEVLIVIYGLLFLMIYLLFIYNPFTDYYFHKKRVINR